MQLKLYHGIQVIRKYSTEILYTYIRKACIYDQIKISLNEIRGCDNHTFNIQKF